MKTHRWKDIRKGKLSEARIAEIEKEVAHELLEMSLRDLRESLGMTQQELAKVIDMTQSEAKLPAAVLASRYEMSGSLFS